MGRTLKARLYSKGVLLAEADLELEDLPAPLGVMDVVEVVIHEEHPRPGTKVLFGRAVLETLH